jgi:hypothetical protein
MLRRFESRRAAEKNRAVSGRRAPIVCLIAVLAVGLHVAPLPQAQACLFLNPICWVEKALDTLKDILGGVAELVSDIIELDPGEFFEDLADIAEDVLICDAGAETTLVELLGGNVAQELFDNCSSSQGIEPEVLAKLQTYMRSSFESVRIHTNCDFPLDREAITFGEHIYFAPGNYHPLWDPAKGDCEDFPCDCREENGVQYDLEGFGILAHELVHVLQYRREGFADFICKYTLECGLGALVPGNSGLSCRFEQEGYVLQALLIEDMRRDGDGIYTCPLGECNDEGGDLHFGNVGFHSCIVEINLCGQVVGEEAPNYCDTNDNCPDVFNPGQEDSDGDGRGDACDQCPEGVTPYQDLDNDCVPDDVDNCACDPADVAKFSDCTQTEAPPSNFNPRCFAESPCLVASNPDQADFDGDGMGDVCDPDDDNDGLKDVEEEIWGTDPKNPDTDGDGLTDGDEVKVHQTNPLDKDTDDDCLTDGFEVAHGLDPLDADMDDDGAVDGKDVEWLEAALAALPPSVFRSTGNRNSMSTLLLAAETQLISDQEGAALLLLQALRSRLDGCGAAAEGNDWITDCAVQTAIRELLDLLISNVETC